MRALTASDLLDVWERGLRQTPLVRAASLLGAAFPERSPKELERTTIGRRDALLLSLRETTFGPRVEAIASCDSCEEPVELNFRLDDVRAEASPDGDEIELMAGNYELRIRLPNSGDLAAVLRRGANARAIFDLFSRCVVRARSSGTDFDPADLPAAVVDEAIEALAKADPQADIRLAIECPQCGVRSRVPFDIVSFFWREIEEFAVRTLREIHALAAAYGWGEAQILALSPARRRCYLEMVGA